MQIEGAEIKWSLFVRARAIDTPALRPWGRGGAWAGRGKRLGLVGPAQPPAACAPAARAMLAGWSGARHTSPARSARQYAGSVAPRVHSVIVRVRYVSRLVLFVAMITDMYAPLPAPPSNKTIVSLFSPTL